MLLSYWEDPELQCLMLYSLPPASPSWLKVLYQRKVLLRNDEGPVSLPLCFLLLELGLVSRTDLLERIPVSVLEVVGSPYGVRCLYRKYVSLEDCLGLHNIGELKHRFLLAKN